MRIRFSFVAALALALVLPVVASASTASASAVSRHHRYIHHYAHTRHYARRASAHRVRYRRDVRRAHERRELRRVHYVHHYEPSRVDRSAHVAEVSASSAAVPFGPMQRIRYIAPLRGSRASLLRQNVRDDAEGLVRFQDDADLDAAESAGKLVLLPAGVGLRVNPSLPYDRRFCRPWTARFLADLARVHYERFHRPLQVNSAVRTVAFQRHLEMINGNAAPAEGDLASPHLTGAAIDIGKKGLTLSEIAWMRDWLLPLQAEGKIDVEEEFYQACFHISVYRNYMPAPKIPRRHSTSTLIAAGVQ